jgi:hypothetical protein
MVAIYWVFISATVRIEKNGKVVAAGTAICNVWRSMIKSETFFQAAMLSFSRASTATGPPSRSRH